MIWTILSRGTFQTVKVRMDGHEQGFIIKQVEMARFGNFDDY